MPTLATYFDSGYLPRGLLCLRSALRTSSTPLALHVLALDDGCARHLPVLLGPLPPGSSLKVIRLAELEARNGELLSVKASRTPVEYFFTLTPFLCRDALRTARDGEVVTYVDADTWFATDPAGAFAGAGAGDIFVTEHRFAAEQDHLATTYGRFNVGWMAFRNGPEAMQCLDGWARNCIAWCGIVPEQNRFGDQKYLDGWPDAFPTLRVVAHPGVNLAPWNLGAHRIEPLAEGLRVDGMPLVLFHFHKLERRGAWRYAADLQGYGALPATVARALYLPYIGELEAAIAECQWLGVTAPARTAAARTPYRAVRRAVGRTVRVLTRERVIFAGGRVLSPLEGLMDG